MSGNLSCEEFVAALDGWVGELVAVRIVAEPDGSTSDEDLVAIFIAELGPRSDEKRPALFWSLLPVAADALGEHAERPGIYLHPERFRAALAHVGGWVLEVRQDGVELNVRRLRGAPERRRGGA